jgi:phosphoglycerate dehydrogenase-like enzyme
MTTTTITVRYFAAARAAAGVEANLFPAMVASDVIFTNAAGVHAVNIPEHAIGLLHLGIHDQVAQLALGAQRLCVVAPEHGETVHMEGERIGGAGNGHDDREGVRDDGRL